MQKPGDQFIPTRATLLSRLKDWDDQESWREFFGLYRRLIYTTALKAGLSEQEADDVVQETMLSVAKSIKDFEYNRERCTFKAWLGQLIQRRIADHYRKRYRQKTVSAETAGTDSATAPIDRVPDPNSADLDQIWQQAWEKELLAAAVEQVKNKINPEQFQMFDFYVLREMPVARVAAALETSVASIYLAKHRVSKLLKKEVRRLETEMG